MLYKCTHLKDAIVSFVHQFSGSELGSLVPRLSLSFSHFFARANFIREKSKERESGPGTEPRPPADGGHLAKVLVATRAFVHSTALALPSGPCLLY